MKISNLGEFAFIKTVNNLFSSKLPKGVVGIGDDCAVITQKNGKALLVSTDSLVENIHFIRKKIRPEDLGYKSIAVNISDIAAMGGVPKYVWLSASLPANTDMHWLNAFLHGVAEISNSYKINLLGGDTTGSEKNIFINVTVIGEAPFAKVKFRSQAKVGDIICVTDNVGDSALGLECISRKIKNTVSVRKLIQKHFRPKPNVAEGLFLAEFSAVHAMIDLSDGIFSDIQRIQEMSHCSAKIYLDKLPCSEEFIKVAATINVNPFEFAVIGGEDYCLLTTIDPKQYENIALKFLKKFKRPLSAIGVITSGQKPTNYYLHEKSYRIHKKVFRHF